ncbi:hypothetical protein ACOMHN_018122 [Nucella lapillus]
MEVLTSNKGGMKLNHDLGDLPQDFTMTVGPDPGQFLICDNGPNRADRLLVFATAAGLQLLAAVETFYMDGNFAMSPNIFCQIYALLPAKTRASYERLFQPVVDKCAELDLELNVQTVVTDFEDAVLRAAVAVFGRDVPFQGMLLSSFTVNMAEDPGVGSSTQTHLKWKTSITLTKHTFLDATTQFNSNLQEMERQLHLSECAEFHPCLPLQFGTSTMQPLTTTHMQERLRNLCIERRDGRKSVEELLRVVSWNIRLNRET